MSRYVFDIEADGFLEDLTKIHSLVLMDADTGELFSYHDDDEDDGLIMPIHAGTVNGVEAGLQRLAEADEIIGHNIIKFDIPAIQKVYPRWAYRGRTIDTMVMARLIYNNIGDWDGKLLKKGKLPGKLFGKHSLEAWGHRLGNFKGEFQGPWDSWSQDMQEYCEQDVRLTHALYQRLLSKKYSQTAIDLEHEVQWVCAQMERNGYPFDVEKAVELYSKLCKRRNELEQELKTLFPPWYVSEGKHTIKRTARYFRQHENGAVKRFVKDKATGRKILQIGAYEEQDEGVVYTKIKLIEFNPNSRHHIADRLITLRGWRPTEFTDGGEPKVDDGILSALPFPEAKLLGEYLMVQKRIAQLAEGDEAWLKLEQGGKIHGGINPNGANSGRATHMGPNMTQVPSVKKPYGKECRSLFYVPEDWGCQVGVDLSGIELRCLAHFMWPYDGGAYAEVVLKGDPHTRHQEAAELESRDQAKTFGYAYIYGAGDEKLGFICKPSATREEARRLGKFKRKLFQTAVTGLGELQEDLRETLKERGYLYGLDGRHLYSRSEHSILNLLLQSAGALIAKRWIVITDRKLRALGLKPGWDGDYCLLVWAHDEQQFAVRYHLEETLREVCVAAAREAGESFNFRLPIDAECKPSPDESGNRVIGRNWAMCH